MHEHWLHHMRMHAGQPGVAASEFVAAPLVVKAGEVRTVAR